MVALHKKREKLSDHQKLVVVVMMKGKECTEHQMKRIDQTAFSVLVLAFVLAPITASHTHTCHANHHHQLNEETVHWAL